MHRQQKALVVITTPNSADGLDELNQALRQGWRVVRVASMGGAGIGVQHDTPDMCFAALVILEHAEDQDDGAQLAQAALLLAREEESSGDVLDDLLEEHGITEPPRSE